MCRQEALTERVRTWPFSRWRAQHSRWRAEQRRNGVGVRHWGRERAGSFFALAGGGAAGLQGY